MAAARLSERRWTWGGLVLALLAAGLWGLAPVATKGALAGFTPEFIGVFRLAGAALLFRLLAGNGARWFVADGWIWLAGTALGVDFVLYNYGLQRTSANVAGLVINVELVSTIGLAVWLLNERLTPHRILGSLVTLGGVLAVSLEGSTLSDLVADERAVGNLLVMSAGVAWSLFAVAQRRAAYRGAAFHRLTPIFTVAALTVSPTLLHRGAWRITTGLTATTMLIILTTFCTGLVYFVYARVQQRMDVSVLAILLSSIPVFSLLFASALLAEPLTLRILLGGAVIVAGIVVVATERHPVPADTASTVEISAPGQRAWRAASRLRKST